jgi:hypothetical protein
MAAPAIAVRGGVTGEPAARGLDRISPTMVKRLTKTSCSTAQISDRWNRCVPTRLSANRREATMIKSLKSNLIAAAVLSGLSSATGPPAYALEQHLLLTNTTRMAIVEIHFSNVGTGNWQEDILGQDFLAPNTSLAVGIDDRGGCRLDVETVFDDGTTLIRHDVDVCAAERFAISGR